jgi:hypothetical protein
MVGSALGRPAPDGRPGSRLAADLRAIARGLAAPVAA